MIYQVIDYSNSLGVNPVVTLCELPSFPLFLSNEDTYHFARSPLGHSPRTIGLLRRLHLTKNS